MENINNIIDYNLLLNTSKKIGVPVKKIVDLLTILSDTEIENNQLVIKTGISKNVLNQIKKELQSLFKPTSVVTVLSEKGRNDSKNFKEQKKEEEMWNVLKDNKYFEITSLFESFQELRPSPKRNLDQFTATIETTVTRGALLNFFGDVRGKNILFLGDDDLTSISTALFGNAHEISVLDIDKDILHEIKLTSSRYNVNINTTQYDARMQLPNNYKGKYDVIFTDPPYTSNGINLFLSRAVSALNKQNLAARIYLCYGTSDRAKERLLPIQEIIFRHGMMTRWIFDKFNRYQGAESIGSSNLYICEITPQTKAIITKDYNGPIYTNN